MTALNAMIQKDLILLSMDTQVSTRTDGKIGPAYYNQKFEVLPFAKSVIAGTGDYDTIIKAMQITKRLLVRDVETLAEMLRDTLKHEELNEERRSTLYLFGYDDVSRIRAFALRSGNSFEIEDLLKEESGILVLKPELENRKEFLDLIENDSLDQVIQGFKLTMRKQKMIDEKKDVGDPERVGIGGENILCLIGENFERINMFKIDRFDDYDEQYNLALSNIHKQLDF
jgi:hypothetical protein